MMPDKPNIVLIMTDQQRADFFRSEGFALDTMPFVEALGRQGARFQRAYTPMPTCAPARCSTLTGRFPKATRVRENGGIANIFRPDDLVGVLRAQGYSIFLSGKNHTYLTSGDFDWAAFYMHVGGGREGEKTEQEAAFDRWLRGLDHGVNPEPAPFPLECQLPHRIVRDAIRALDNRDKRKPFFLWLSFPEPHNPYQVPEPYFSLFAEGDIPAPVAPPEAAQAKGPKWRWMQRLIEEKRPGYREQWRRYRANYCGMLRLIDDQIRRFVAHLEATGAREETLLLFTSDHGDYAGDYGLQRKGVELPECLVRVPLLLAGPGVVPSDTPREDFVSLVDLFPTLCEAVGTQIPYGVQGRSLWPLLTGQPYPEDEFRSIYSELGIGGLHYAEDERPPLHFPYEGPGFDELNSVTQSGNLKMVRKGKWKLLFDMLGRGQLYDLDADPAELVDRWDDPALRDVRREMAEELLRWTIRTEDDLPGGRYTPKRAPRNWYAPRQAEERHEAGSRAE
jgi:arylsulfatase A-like enzyme